jgi:hypothetical protein
LAWIAAAVVLGAGATAPAAASAAVDDEPGATTLGAGDISLFARADDNTLAQRTFGPAGWTDWSGAGGALGSGPRAVVFGSAVHVFARAPNGEFVHRGGTGAWETLDGALTSAPGAAVRRGLGYLDVAVRGTDNAVFFRSYVPGTGWSPWDSRGGVIQFAPSVVSYKPNIVHVFAIGTDGALDVMYWTGSAWSAWSTLGGVATSAPAAISDGDGRIDVFVRGTDAAIHRISWRDGSGWSAWSRIDPAPVSSGVAAVVLGADHYALFARSDSQIVENVLADAAWSGWQPVRVTPPPPPPPPPTGCGHSAAKLQNAFRGKRRRTVDYGHGATITGVAQGPDRRPVAGAVVHVLDTRAHTEVGQTTAGADGRFRFKVPPGTSRTLRAGFEWGGEGFFACGMSLSLKVRAGVRLRGSRHVRVHGRIRLRGHLLGDHIPPRGKLIELQGWARGAWQLFRQVRTNRGGQFRATYRLRTRARGTLKIRARVRAERGYPYTLGWSPVIHVRVG